MHWSNYSPKTSRMLSPRFWWKTLRTNNEEYKALCAALYVKTRKGKKEKFLRYCKNLRYDSFDVYSYNTTIIELNWKNRTAKRLGRWTATTTTHMNYAIHMLTICYDFKELQ